jgi:hypothetical protein
MGGTGVLVNVQFKSPPSGEEIYIGLARPWPGVGTVLYKMDRDVTDVLKLI